MSGESATVAKTRGERLMMGSVVEDGPTKSVFAHRAHPYTLGLFSARPNLRMAKTHRLVVLHEAVEAFGVGAEIAARMADVGFDELDAPIVRVGAPFMPVPFARSLEQAYLPNAEKAIAAVRRVLE